VGPVRRRVEPEVVLRGHARKPLLGLAQKADVRRIFFAGEERDDAEGGLPRTRAQHEQQGDQLPESRCQPLFCHTPFLQMNISVARPRCTVFGNVTRTSLPPLFTNSCAPASTPLRSCHVQSPMLLATTWSARSWCSLVVSFVNHAHHTASRSLARRETRGSSAEKSFAAQAAIDTNSNAMTPALTMKRADEDRVEYTSPPG